MKFAASLVLLVPILAMTSGRPLRNEVEETNGSIDRRVVSNNSKKPSQVPARFPKPPVKAPPSSTKGKAAAKATTTAVAKGAKGSATTSTTAAAKTSVASKGATASNSTNTATGSSATESIASTGGAAASNSTASAAPPAATTGVTTATEDNTNEQDSLTLDKSVIGSNLEQDGQEPPVAGQSPSLTSQNNYINSCVGKVITNGLQNIAGSCNPVPMGDIPAKTKMPAGKFVFPPNMGSVGANTNFTIQLALSNLHDGVFTNAQTTYYAAPQQLDSSGLIIGHTHVVIQPVNGLGDTSIPDITSFTFFKGIDLPSTGGIASAAVVGGVAAGTYRLCSINTSANHVPVILPIAQHGMSDDCSYFTAK
ncbi:hypothetical protein FRB98_003222 [Tulasnella sp. 332]|nr:hypothetical protein FRB98_003222 [Tulasnella sp. 332]